MADLNFKAQIELIDKMTAPMRSLSSQANRLGKQFGETAKQAKQLQGQQRLVNSFRQQTTAVLETSRAYEQNKQRLNQLNAQIKATSTPSKTLLNQFESAQRQSQKLGSRLQSQKQHLSQLKGKLGEAGIATDKLGDYQQRLGQKIESTNNKIADQRQRMAKMRNLQQQSQQMGDMRNQAVGVAMGGAAATYAGVKFIQPGVELGGTMARVSALTRLDKNSEQYKALEAQAKKLGATTQFTASDAAAGQSFLAMAGFTPASIQKAMPGMLDLALAGGIELDRTADIASNILTGMKMDPSEMQRLGDVMTSTFTRANVDVSMLGETMKYASPVAADLGVTIEQLTAMTGKLGDAGIQGSMAGTSLRGIMGRLAAPTKRGISAMREIGLETNDANGNLRAMPDILKDIYDKTKGMGSAYRAEIFKSLAGDEAFSALSVLAEQAGSGKLQELIAINEQSTGEMAEIQKKMVDHAGGDYKAMQSAADALRTSFYDANKDSIRGFLQGLTELIQKLTIFANEHPQAVAMAGKLFGMLALGAVVFGTLTAGLLTVLGPMAMLRASLVTLGLPTTLTPFGLLKGSMTKLGSGFMWLLPKIGQLTKLFAGGLFRSIGLVAKGLRMLGVLAMTNPILAIISIIAMGAFFIWKNWDTLGPKFWALVALIKGYFSDLWVQAQAIWHRIKTGIINYANQLWAGLGIKFNSGIAGLIAILVAFSPIGLFIRAFVAVWQWFGGLHDKFKGLGGYMMQGLKDGILGHAKDVINAITGVAKRIKGAFTSSRGMDIHSPSRVFDKYGVYTMQGLGGGIKRWASMPINAVAKVADKLKAQDFTLGNGMLSTGLQIASKLPAFNSIKRLINNYSPINFDTLKGAGRYLRPQDKQNVNHGLKRITNQPPIRTDNRRTILPAYAHGGGRGTAGMVTNMGGITINITGANDPHAVAQEVRLQLEKIQRDNRARNRTRFADID